ncbi:MAG TPA: tRNA pseudouridine(55) synthase TruB [Bacilli bacterium]
MKQGIEGVIPVWKPSGWTSHDVVAKARRILRQKKIGHTGTLDPQATGVLPLCVGRATRFVEYLQELPKEYRAKLIIGYATDTEDITGNVIEQAESVQLSAAQIEQALRSFHGTIRQVPPMYSALKINGKKLYELAREGKTVERKPRLVEIYRIDMVEMDLQRRYPEITFAVTCSKGTYIRTLCKDIGQALGYPAVMADLVRTMTANFRSEQCVTLGRLAELAEAGAAQTITVPPDQAIGHMPAVMVRQTHAAKALSGQKISFSACSKVPNGSVLVRLYDEANTFLGVFQTSPGDSCMQPVKVFQ